MLLTGLLKTTAAAAVALGVLTGTSIANAATSDGDIPTPVVSKVSATSGHVSYARKVTLTGTAFQDVSAVYLDTTKLTDFHRISATQVSATVGHAPKFAAGKHRFYLQSDGLRFETTKSFTYKVTSSVDREMRYMGANLDRRSAGSGYAYYAGNDCANFTSQSLHARGLSETGSWYPGASNWVSSTRLRSYLLNRGVVREYGDTQANRAKVHVGDVIQFDWDRSGDRDHTGIVSKITKDASGKITIYYSAHTDARPPHVNNSPSHDLSIEQSKINHKTYYKLKSFGKAYFLVFK